MARTIGSFKILGVSIRFDASWIVLALLIAWSLASGVFPELHPGLARASYWGMAGATVLGVAASIIAHELAHSLAAGAYGQPVSGITLFVFGGVAEMTAEPKGPVSELVIAIVGPLLSLILGAAFMVTSGAAQGAVSTELYGVLHYLGVLNIALAAFNMAPAFPLDGGRVLRALIWLLTSDYGRATRIAAGCGQFVGGAMMAIGVIAALSGELVGGLWWIVLGFFLNSMASAHRHAAFARAALAGARVRDLMTASPVTVPASMSVEEFVNQVLARHPHDLVPVMGEGRVLGGVGFKEVRALDRDLWAHTPLIEVCTPITDIPTCEAGDDWSTALERMQSARASRIIVFDHGALAGILTLKDLAAHLRLRTELGVAGAPNRGA